MFSFKPRVYRSVEGCCICRAKSSSSRFTDSRKYEEDSIKCFDLKYPRKGEICNACVLLVKRYKRLPTGSQRNWSHVVDARAGPGTKTLIKAKRIKEENYSDSNSSQPRHVSKSIIVEKFHKIFKKSKKIKAQSPSRNNIETSIEKETHAIESNNENESRESSPGLSHTNISPHNIVLFQTQTRASAFRAKHNTKRSIITKSINSNVLKPLPNLVGTKKRKKMKPRKLDVLYADQFNFFDENEWKKRNTCCGIFYECDKLNGAIMIDVDQYKICPEHAYRKEDNQNTSLHMEELKCSTKTNLPEVVKVNLPGNIDSSIKSTTVLKKHHLFLKRQSECLPSVKNDSCAAANTDIDIKTTTLKQHDEVQKQHSIATTTLTKVPLAATSSNNSTSFLHKIKSDAGKIVKHSVNKFSSAIRLKAQDLSEIKHMVKTADKNYLLSKALTTTATSQTISTVSAVMTTTPLTTDNLSPSSTSSSTTSATSSNKFSDNSSDSGFDENDRKSVSPLQQENDTKNIATARPPVQTLILTSGIRVHGQPQNVVYAGNELTAKILQQRVQQQNATTLSSSAILQHNKLLNVQSNEPTQLATSLKILQSKTNANSVFSIGAYNLSGAKIRALYNKNAIKHENGITTIVPASSLNATNKCTMQTNAPNTITIIPASSASAQKRPITIPINYQQHNG